MKVSVTNLLTIVCIVGRYFLMNNGQLYLQAGEDVMFSSLMSFMPHEANISTMTSALIIQPYRDFHFRPL